MHCTVAFWDEIPLPDSCEFYAHTSLLPLFRCKVGGVKITIERKYDAL